MLSIYTCKSHSRTIGIMNADISIKVGKLLLKILHRSHLREGRLVSLGTLGTIVEQLLPQQVERMSTILVRHNILVVLKVLGIVVYIAEA